MICTISDQGAIMKLITDTDTITRAELRMMAEKMYGDLVKAVVDIYKGIMVVDADLHADQEEFLLEQGAEQANLWGINLHPSVTTDDWIEFDSMINIRPSQKNRSRYIEDPHIRAKIIEIVARLVQ
jgi:hypothetical protein